MEMSLREWLIILGIIIIAAVIIDGLRRVRRARQDSREIAESMGVNTYQSPVEESYNPELPNQGFRVIRKGEDSKDFASQVSEMSSAVQEARLAADAQQIDEDQTKTRFSDDLSQARPHNDNDMRQNSGQWQYADDQHTSGQPTLGACGSGEGKEIERETGDGVRPAEDKFTAFDGDSDIQTDDIPLSADSRAQSFIASETGDSLPEDSSWQKDSRGSKDSKKSLHGSHAAAGDDFKDRFLKKITSTQASGTKAFKSTLNSRKSSSKQQNHLDEQREKQSEQDFDEVIIVNVLARGSEEFEGEQLKNLIEACGMQLGDMSIYHRHEYDFDKGPVQFSMANALPPGTFTADLEKTPGVSFFVKLPGPDESMLAFDYMIETAQCIVRNLGGELRDENHSVMTTQTIEHCRQRVREFERRQLSQRV